MIIRMCRIMKLLILAISCFVLLGCNSTKGEQQVASNQSNNVVCESVASVGSHMKRRVCKTKAQKDQDKKDAERYLRQERRVVNTGK